jgi:fructose/tagatose bisphosphate aldolase
MQNMLSYEAGEAAIEDTGLPICLHLDHGEDFENASLA